MSSSVLKDSNLGDLGSRLASVKNKIAQSIHSRGGDATEVTLVAASKSRTSEEIHEAFRLGQTDFGENYVQEGLSKQVQLAALPLRWHFIGRLQRNKVKNVVGSYWLIHSVDSLSLAEKISKSATEKNLVQKILFEINLGGEASKAGYPQEALFAELNLLLRLPNLELCGLMALPPLLPDDPEGLVRTRMYFRELRSLFYSLQQRLPSVRQEHWKTLSMGTTHDFEVAIEEGANIVRVGTAIFGERD